jgi:membrane fusion protein (multidrug efflux system)
MSVRQRAFLILGSVLAVAAIVWAGYWLLYLRHYETTDDAYVAGDVVLITSEVPGTVTAVYADDTQSVTRGQALVELDPADARVAVAGAEAELARAVRDVSALYAQQEQLRADVVAREVALERATRDLERRQPLQADGAVSSEELAHGRNAVAELSASLTAARAQLQTISAQVRGTSVATHPQVQRAAAALRAASLTLRRTHLSAPVAGIVAKRNAQIGERVAAGVPLLAVVPLKDVWVDANFKEVQLRSLRVGQPATLQADVYGSEVTFHGKVAGLAAGSGSAFALLPAQNASGNWIKIVQRVPVRISLDPREVEAHPLRIGTSTVARIDVADTSGPLVAGTVRRTPAPALETADDGTVEQRILAIIVANSPSPGAAVRRGP